MKHPSNKGRYCDLVLNEAIHSRVIADLLPQAERFVWIVTADIKDMYVRKGQRFVPFLEILSELVSRGVAVRLFHAKEPGPRFREDFDKQTPLLGSDLFERLLCPRIHTKAVIIDGCAAFVGSANLTGAGLGAKHPDKRNFEAGFVTNMPEHIEPLMGFIDELYLGKRCADCRRRDVCPDPIAWLIRSALQDGDTRSNPGDLGGYPRSTRSPRARGGAWRFRDSPCARKDGRGCGDTRGPWCRRQYVQVPALGMQHDARDGHP